MSIGAIIEKRIRRLMAERGIKVGELQEAAGVNEKYLLKMRAGKLGPTVGTLKPIKERLATTWDYLIDGKGDHRSSVLIPQPDFPPELVERDFATIREMDVRLAAGGGSIVDGATAVRRTWGLPHSFLYALSLDARHSEFVEIVGDSMYPLLWPGDMVLVDRRSTCPDHRAIYALSDGDAIVCKWVERDRTVKAPPTYLLSSENEAYPPYKRLVADANIAGRVVWFGRRL